ncbi:sugar-binding domain-containing protein, partial [Armatimonas sp.]|uniref:sugar-binding domain-containing protein n=1 Tax=Armatimonas sp. TaxID=1872638 RepID=UPI003750279F
PEGGAVLRYDITIPKGTTYEVWNRIGYEFARSDFDWRLDGGAWQRVTPETLTTDLMSLETWNEVAWLRLGAQKLGSGAHTLEIRLPKDAKKRVLYASDALCFYAGTWHPYGRYKPGEEHRSERDRAAAAQAFTLGTTGPRPSVSLAGDWEVCRADEQTPPFDIAQPMEIVLPPDPKWSAITVPSDKNIARPDLTFAHRLWYRTRVNIPAASTASRYILTFPRNNLNTTVIVNGMFCGFNKNPNAKFDIDITKAIQPGKTNEIRVGIRDAWYGYSTSPTDPLKLRKKFNLPLSVVGTGFQDLAYPIWNAWQSGLVQTPVLTRTGAAQIHDVFIQPDVSGKRLNFSYAMHPSEAPRRYEVLDSRTGAVVARWQSTNKPQEAEQGNPLLTVRESLPFPEARPWWPEPNPQLYTLRIICGDDVQETRFGFRQWDVRGKDFTLNGQVWHGWADLGAGSDPKSWLQNYRTTNQRFMRLAGHAQGGPSWLGLTPDKALDFFDESGVVVRRSGDLDGEAIGYMAIEGDDALKKLYG